MSRGRLLRLLAALSGLAIGAPASAIRGNVQTFDGTPIVRAGVSLLSSLRGFTDERGFFELKAIPEGVYDIKIEMPGFHTVAVKSVSVRSNESKTLPPITLDVSAACEGPYAAQWLEPTEDHSSGELTSTVSDRRGRPLARVEVKVHGGTPVRTTMTDAQGTFRIANLTAGLYSAQLHRSGYWDTEAKDLRVEAGYVTAYWPFRLGRCPLGWCNPIFRRRQIVRCE